ncbi:hypothetical protein LCGC14_2058610, partial [marine sediment metagenome]
VNETHAKAGIITTAPGAGEGGVVKSSTTAMTDALGLTLDTVTAVTAQQTDGTSTERNVTVIISPDAVYRSLISGGATEGTALVEYTVSTAMTDGLTLTDTSVTWTSPAWDEGSVFFTSGVNKGQHRKVIATGGSNVATFKNAFDFDSAVNDTYVKLPWWFCDATSNNLQSTTNLYQANALIAVGTGGAVRVIDMELDENDTSGMYVLFTLDDHALNHHS